MVSPCHLAKNVRFSTEYLLRLPRCCWYPPCTRGSAGNDRGGERDPMVFCPRRSQRRPRSVKHIAGSFTEDSGRLRLDVLRVEEVNLPATHVSTLREHLAVHDRVGPGLVRRAALDDDVVWEVERPGSQRHRDDRSGQRGGELLQRSRCCPQHRRPDLRDHPRGVVVIERLGFVFDRCRRHTGFDQLDPPAIHDDVPGRCSDSHGPAEMMGDPDTHALKYLASRVPVRTVIRSNPRAPGQGTTCGSCSSACGGIFARFSVQGLVWHYLGSKRVRRGHPAHVQRHRAGRSRGRDHLLLAP